MKAIFVATAVAVSALLLAGCREHASEVVVPKVLGMRAAAAQALLERTRLRPQWEQGATPDPSNAFLLPDTIIAQAPSPGENVKRGSAVLLVPSSGKVVTDDFAAQVAGRIQRDWRGDLHGGAAADPAKHLRSPPRAWLRERLRATQDHWRGPHAGGGQWAAGESLYSFQHL